MSELGSILRFDEARGYGFIVPDKGSGDVFVHVNEIQDDESRYVPGARVRFESKVGERGRKAYAVTLAEDADRDGADEPPMGTRAKLNDPFKDDGMCDLLTTEEMRADITEMLLAAGPELNGEQILRLRQEFVALARRHGWVEG